MTLNMKTGKLGHIATLDHVNVLTNDVEECRRFYVDGLGFEEGWRPNFNQPGLWLYSGSVPVVHVMQTKSPLPDHSGELGDDHLDCVPKDCGAVDHIAFRAHNFEKFTARLDANGIKWTDREVPGMDLHQVFCYDPHGVKCEFNFEGQDRPWKTLERVQRDVQKERLKAKTKAKGKSRARKKAKVTA